MMTITFEAVVRPTVWYIHTGNMKQKTHSEKTKTKKLQWWNAVFFIFIFADKESLPVPMIPLWINTEALDITVSVLYTGDSLPCRHYCASQTLYTRVFVAVRDGQREE